MTEVGSISMPLETQGLSKCLQCREIECRKQGLKNRKKNIKEQVSQTQAVKFNLSISLELRG